MLDTDSISRSASYIFGSITDDVARGQTFSNALAEFLPIFGAFSVNIVRVGESSGTLPANLTYLAEELKKKDALKKKVIGALVYPAVIVCATIGISVVLTAYIFPKIIPIFQGFKQQLPLPTRILIAASEVLQHDGFWLLAVFVAASFCLVLLLRSLFVRRFVDRAVLSLPILGTLYRSYNLANITRTMSLLISGDVRIVTAIGIIAESTSNIAYREDLDSHCGCGASWQKAVGRNARMRQSIPDRYPKFRSHFLAMSLFANIRTTYEKASHRS